MYRKSSINLFIFILFRFLWKRIWAVNLVTLVSEALMSYPDIVTQSLSEQQKVPHANMGLKKFARNDQTFTCFCKQK